MLNGATHHRTNPWFSMWFLPRRTMRTLLDSNPKYGILYLAALFALQGLFFYASWWSLGLNFSWYAVVAVAVVLSPFAGMLWLYFAGWIFYLTGRWLHGRAPASHLRLALAWSKIPVSINLLAWIALLIAGPGTAFIQDAGWSSSLFVNFLRFATGIWSFLLLVQSVREIQDFPLGRSIINVLMAWVIYFLCFMIFFSVARYIYLITV